MNNKVILFCLSIILVLCFFPNYTKLILLLSSLVLLFPNNMSLNPVSGPKLPWIDRYNGLVAWMSAHGGAWPRRRHHLGPMSSMSEADAEEHRHALWVKTQRLLGAASLSKEIEANGMSRADLLERLEGWVWKEVRVDPWMSRYEGLVAWMSAHGGAWPRVLHHRGRTPRMSQADAEEHRHALWMQSQRTRGRRTLLSIEAHDGISRAEMLERLDGWVWQKFEHSKESWMTRYNGLVAWMSAHGGAWPRQRQGRLSSMSEEIKEEHRHASWLNHQRHKGRTRLSQEMETSEGVSRAELLERLSGWSSYLWPRGLPSQPPPPRPINLSVEAILEDDRMKRRRIEEDIEAENIMRGWAMEEMEQSRRFIG